MSSLFRIAEMTSVLLLIPSSLTFRLPPLALPTSTKQNFHVAPVAKDDAYSDGSLPRLHKNIPALISFVESNRGYVGVDIIEEKEGWRLYTKQAFLKDQVVARVPKKICLFSDTDKMTVPLNDNAQKLITSIDASQWRLRLSIAILSERVRPSSFFDAYLRNLPFEFWGIPLFFNSDEFRYDFHTSSLSKSTDCPSAMQDLSLMHRTRERCRVLTNLMESVIGPLQKTPLNPFNGNAADVDSLGESSTSISRVIS